MSFFFYTMCLCESLVLRRREKFGPLLDREKRTVKEVGKMRGWEVFLLLNIWELLHFGPLPLLLFVLLQGKTSTSLYFTTGMSIYTLNRELNVYFLLQNALKQHRHSLHNCLFSLLAAFILFSSQIAFIHSCIHVIHVKPFELCYTKKLALP